MQKDRVLEQKNPEVQTRTMSSSIEHKSSVTEHNRPKLENPSLQLSGVQSVPAKNHRIVEQP